jgi:hypothetical protein
MEFRGTPQLEPVYQTRRANETILLFKGPLQFTQEGRAWHGDGTIRFEWVPTADVFFEIPDAQPGLNPVQVGAEGTLRIPPRMCQ